MSTTSISVSDHFNAVAAKYEASTGGCTRELAKYLVDILPPFDEATQVLDNACGPGVLAQEIVIKQHAANKEAPSIACVDFAPAMVELARTFPHAYALPAEQRDRITFDVMSGEDIRFPDDQFTHSITNQGILFFKDGPKGASEIFRTLKPGGTAIVTSWAKLGYINLIHHAQSIVRPGGQPFRLPVSDDWFQGAHLEKTLKDAGFGEVQVHEKTVHYAAKSVTELCDQLTVLFAAGLGLSDSENVVFRKELQEAAEKVVVKVERFGSSRDPDRREELIGVPMVALVAVAKK
ncbi:S-adenosyl-L-methionine-dependent methyltransferase [Paraphoma chrysanthemicola]|uniref:S-adenosyl-L-methionine-dependent methyltransferase n=1 Tax=Paraphoma chrysanthemicola TaxID=798071 RepID=A0A8K0RAK7_9PLEO|nr:S-adenosyl-L-methionine-dependent methyltransferase [Paraphoma chrysanthemicola]